MEPASVWGAWTLAPGLVVGLAGAVVVYGRGVRTLWARGGRGAGISVRRVRLFACGVAVLALALLSPLDAMGGALFSAHMAQHLLLTLVVAPLLVAGRLPRTFQALVSLPARRRWARAMPSALRPTAPAGMVVAVVLHVTVVVTWHVPAVYDLAVGDPSVHALEHLTLLLAAMPFWAAMGAGTSRPVGPAGLAAFVAALSFILLAASLSMSPTPWYDAHLASTTAWGLTPLQDQQLAAAMMWIPGGLVYLAATAASIVRWIRADERAQRVASTPR